MLYIPSVVIVQTLIVGGIIVRVLLVVKVDGLAVNLDEAGQVEAVVEAVLEVVGDKYAVEALLDLVGITVVLVFLGSPRRHTLFARTLSLALLSLPPSAWLVVLNSCACLENYALPLPQR